ncbi:MAG: MMPL family transporter [Pirellulaceae bacterium]|nr:MMPL family transporter [Pirellulaceae bacterium]
MARHWALVLASWLVVVAVVHYAAPRWDTVTRDGDFAYLPDVMTSVRGERLLASAFPDYYSKSQLAFVVVRDEGRLAESDLQWADKLLAAFPPNRADEAILGDENGATRPASAGATSDDGSATVAETSPPIEPTETDRDPAETNARHGGPKTLAAGAVDPANPVTAVWSFNTPVIGKKLVSRPSERGQAALIVLHLRNEFMAINNMAFLRRVYSTLDELRRAPDFPEGLKLGVTGSAAIGADMLFSAEESIRNTELTTIVLVVLILLVVYRAPGLVLVPLVTIGASVWLAMDLVASAAALSDSVSWIDFKTFKTTRIFIVVILFGAGTDFCLFLISRYKEELRRGLAYPDAAAAALGHVGNALAASALTTVFGLAMMYFADFGKFSNSGPAIGLCLMVALAACVTLAPALLCAARGVVFWPFGSGVGSATGPEDDPIGPRSRWTGAFWERLAKAILARPGLVLVGSLLVLLPLTRPVRVLCANLLASDDAHADREWDVPVTYDILAELSDDRPSVVGTRLLWRYFPADETGPLTVLIHHPNVDFNSDEGKTKIAALTQELFAFEYVDRQGEPVRPIVSVRSLSEPMGGTPRVYNPLSTSGLRNAVARRRHEARERFVSQTPPWTGRVTRLDIVSIHAPFSKESIDLFNRIETLLLEKTKDPAGGWLGAEVDFVGTAAGIRDLERVTASDRARIKLLVVIAVLGVLVALLRRPLICVYLILSVLLGYFVTIGTTELLFAWLYGDAFTGLDWKVPIFLFVILIAVGQDYNIYLTTRVFEEQRRLGPTEGLRVALIRTGGIITSCGVIMAGTFASMASGTLRTMQELGFALSMGVLLDTFVIRTILVPAFLALLARREERSISPEANETTGQATESRPHGRSRAVSV